jgi:hypothetical protein
MASTRINLDELLERVGMKAGFLRRLKLGQGVAGHMTTIGVAAIVCLTVVAFAFPPSWPAKAGAIILIAALAFYLLNRLERLAREAPEVGLLGGAEFLLSHRKDSRPQSTSDAAAAGASEEDAPPREARR